MRLGVGGSNGILLWGGTVRVLLKVAMVADTCSVSSDAQYDDVIRNRPAKSL